MAPIPRLLSRWRADPSVGGNIAATRLIPARQAVYQPIPDDLHPKLKAVLAQQGITSLYSHQAEAYRLAHRGDHVVVVTGTASGKTLGYHLPVLDALLRDPGARALYLFPTKALAQDQAAGLAGFQLPVPVAVYDGDTPRRARPNIRKRAQVIISNPDMLHAGILPFHTEFVDFFSQLQFVVLDEMHVYRGVFGSHVANVIRRLQRIARHYGAQPQFMLSTATIANPTELAERLIAAPAIAITQDGAARGAKHFLIYNPPIVDRELGLRRSALHEAVKLADDLLTYNLQTIIFARSRRTVEIVLTYLRQVSAAESENHGATSQPASSQEIIRGYRSGYLPQQRREIEEGLRAGRVRAVVATNALELGIDIGGIKAAILIGYPGTIAAAWQQAGRAGRGRDTALAILVATASPLDQFFAHQPEYLFGRSPEQALINPDNLLILLDHIRCAAFELPFRQGEPFGSLPPEYTQEILDHLVAEGVFHQSGDRYYWMSDQYPARHVSLRTASPENILLQVQQGDTCRTIGEVDLASAIWMAHPGAVYLHEGQTFLVEELDLFQKVARLRGLATDYYTLPTTETEIQLLKQLASSPVVGCEKGYGSLQVTTWVKGFRKIRWHTHEHLGAETLSLPPNELFTTGYWLALGDSTVDALRQQGLWSSDPNRYGPNWEEQRTRARARDGYRCQACGRREDGRAHHVHHKTPFRLYFRQYGEGAHRLANRLENLVTLCPPCHRKVETAVRIRSGLAGLAHVLAHLAPLFLMCDVADLGVHSDPQSPITAGQPTAGQPTAGQPTVVLYDRVPAGIGLSQRLYEIHDELMLRARQLIETCECSAGCPSCVGPGGENGDAGKPETLALLRALSAGGGSLPGTVV